MYDEEKLHIVNVNIPFPSLRVAEIAFEVLRVDTEPKRSGVTKSLSLNGTVLNAKFSAELARQIRTAVNSFFENIILIIQTFETLGNPVSESYSHHC